MRPASGGRSSHIRRSKLDASSRKTTKPFPLREGLFFVEEPEPRVAHRFIRNHSGRNGKRIRFFAGGSWGREPSMPLKRGSGVCAFGASWERWARRHRERFAHRTVLAVWASTRSKTARLARSAAWERFCPTRIGACWDGKARMRPGAWALIARARTVWMGSAPSTRRSCGGGGLRRR
jgi:hypothetical protein